MATQSSAASLQAPSCSHPFRDRLKEALIACSKSIEGGDFSQSEKLISELTELLSSFSDTVASEPDKEASESQAFAVLAEIHRYITAPSLDQAVIDALSFELPKAVARFACASGRCVQTAESIIDRFIQACSPRDMITVFCEALDSPSKLFNSHGYFAPLLSGLAKVFVLIRRRHFELVKEAVPVVLNVLKDAFSNSDVGETDFKDLFARTVGIASSIQAVCINLRESKVNKKLHALLGLFILEIMALVSFNVQDGVSCYLHLVLQLSCFLQYCNLSYLGLITGHDVDTIASIVLGDDENDYMSYFPSVKHGASLTVIWGHMFNEVAQAAGEDLAAVKNELHSSKTKRLQTVGMLKNIFLCVKLPWEFKKHAISFLLCIADGNVPQNHGDEHEDYSVYMPCLFSALQGVQMVIIYAPDAVLRKNAFDALKKVLADIQSSLRFDILKALIKNSDSSSMIAILVDCVKDEMRMENPQKVATGNKEVLQAQNNACQRTSFWSPGVLDLVATILRPPHGGPPCLPEYGDAVLSALNLYRYVLIAESTGKTNYTGALSKKNLQKSYSEWLLPLRTLVTGIVAENQEDYDQLAVDTVCGLNPIELVLYRCIELVEEKLKQPTEPCN